MMKQCEEIEQNAATLSSDLLTLSGKALAVRYYSRKTGRLAPLR
jgi:hypothetical protein